MPGAPIGGRVRLHGAHRGPALIKIVVEGTEHHVLEGAIEIISKYQLQIEDYVSFNDQHYTYLARGVYIEQIQRWMKFFPKERFLILKSEDFYADPATAVQQTIAFLEVPVSGWSAGKKEFQAHNTGGRYFGMEPALRERLLDYNKPYNTRLYEFLGIDFGWDR